MTHEKDRGAFGAPVLESSESRISGKPTTSGARSAGATAKPPGATRGRGRGTPATASTGTGSSATRGRGGSLSASRYPRAWRRLVSHRGHGRNRSRRVASEPLSPGVAAGCDGGGPSAGATRGRGELPAGSTRAPCAGLRRRRPGRRRRGRRWLGTRPRASRRRSGRGGRRT